MSSSSDEDVSKFKEAADVKLFNDRLFTEVKVEPDETAPAKPSLRYLDVPDENRTKLKVTPGFQKHVASRLMKFLDSSLDHDTVPTEKGSPQEADSKINPSEDEPENNPKGGIKLFGASATFLLSCDIKPPPTRRRKRGRNFACLSSDSDDDDSSGNEADVSSPPNKNSPDKVNPLGVRDETDLSEKFAACAVSSDWILNGNAVKGWAPPLKNKEPIQGDATPDLLQITVNLYKRKKKKRKSTLEKLMKQEKEETVLVKKKRGKRGGLKKNKIKKENGDVEEGFDQPESFTKAPKKKRRKEPGTENTENDSVGKENARKGIYNEMDDFVRKERVQGTSDEVVDFEYRDKREKKKKRLLRRMRCKADILHAKICEKELVREGRKKKQIEKDLLSINKKMIEGENRLPLAPAEDEGFDSDPTKSSSKRLHRRLLRRQAKKIRRKQKKTEKKWKNKMEYLSNDLANLAMTNVKQG